MRKEEYMTSLQAALQGFEEDLVQEIVADYEERFRIGAERGKSEEQVIVELGSVEELVMELSEMQNMNRQDGPAGAKTEQKEEHEENQTGGGTYYQEKSFAESLDLLMKKVGKVLDITMREAGKAVEDAMEQVEIHVEEAKRRRSHEEYENEFEHSEGENGEEYNVEMTGIADENCRRIKIDAGIANVNVRKATGKVAKAECHYYSHKTAMAYPFYAKQEGDCFYVGIRKNDETRSGFFQFNMAPAIAIDVVIPTGMELVELEAGSGDVEVREVETDVLCTMTKSGDVSVSYFGGRECRLEALSGDISLEKSKLQSATVTAKSGDCTVSKVEVKEVSVSTSSGDVEINGVQAEKVSIGAMSGDLAADDVCADTLKVTTASGDISIKDCRGNLLIADSASGDMNIAADVKAYEVNTKSGDVALESRHDANVTTGSTSGDVRVQILEAKAPYQVTLHSVAGDCTSSGCRSAAEAMPGEEIYHVEARSISGDVTVRFSN